MSESVPGARRILGIGASPGIGIGAAVIYGGSTAAAPSADAVVQETVRKDEVARLGAALASAALELEMVREQVQVAADGAAADIFEAQALFLQDPALLDPIIEAIQAQGSSAEQAVTIVFTAAARDLAAIGDPYLSARAADLRDVAHRLLRVLRGDTTISLTLPDQPSVLIARDLTPSETVSLRRESIAAILLAEGTSTAHAAILARGLGIPMVAGGGEGVWDIQPGQSVIVDGEKGLAVVEPEEAERAAYLGHQVQLAAQLSPDTLSRPPYRTADGRRITLEANASSVTEARLALEQGAEGLGLLRTEFLLAALDAPPGQAPDVAALAAAYGSILQMMAGMPVTVRALDAGGDKPFPFLSFGQEANPFLGWRGIRILLDEPELFSAQIRALLRAAAQADTELRLLFPMITTVDEFVRARSVVEMVQLHEGPRLAYPLRFGAMIETPAAALTAVALAREADFFSLGTNDLTQYTLATDRGNPRVVGLCRFEHPAVLRLVQMTVEAAHAAGRTVSVCGEAAGDAASVPLLIGLGVDTLSVSPARLPALRRLLSNLSYARLHVLAAEACKLATAAEVTALLDL